MMNVFHYDPTTGAYLGQSVADESPLEPGVYLVPAFATDIEPPEPAEGMATVFADGAWQQVAIVTPDPEPDPEPEPVDMVARVIAERARRLAMGFDYDFADSRGVHRIGTTAEDMVGWNEVATVASALIAMGMGTATIDVVTDTGPVQLTAQEFQLILLAAAQFRQPIWAASFTLQAMQPIPNDVESDLYWPAI